jgi:hypothetical protein
MGEKQFSVLSSQIATAPGAVPPGLRCYNLCVPRTAVLGFTIAPLRGW